MFLRNKVSLNVVFDAIRANPVVKRLHLPGCTIDAEALPILAALLEAKNCCLSSLAFFDSDPESDGRRRLVQAFGRNSTLTELYVAGNKIVQDGIVSTPEHIQFLLESLCHRGAQLRQLSFAPTAMTPELIESLGDFLEVCDGLEHLDLDFKPLSKQCATKDVMDFCLALGKLHSLKHLALDLSDQDGDVVSQVLDAALSSQTLFSLVLRLGSLTRDAAKKIHRVIAKNHTQSLEIVTMHIRFSELGAAQHLIASMAVNTTLPDVTISCRGVRDYFPGKLEAAGLMNAVWTDGIDTEEIQQNQLLFYLLGSRKDKIVMRAYLIIGDFKDLDKQIKEETCGDHIDILEREKLNRRSKMGVTRSEDTGALRLIIVSHRLHVSHDIDLPSDVELSRSAEERAMVTLRYLNTNGTTEEIRLNFSTTDLAEELLAPIPDEDGLEESDRDLEESDRNRILHFGVENANRFEALFAPKNNQTLVSVN
jgi:hypothetical protein